MNYKNQRERDQRERIREGINREREKKMYRC